MPAVVSADRDVHGNLLYFLKLVDDPVVIYWLTGVSAGYSTSLDAISRSGRPTPATRSKPSVLLPSPNEAS